MYVGEAMTSPTTLKITKNRRLTYMTLGKMTFNAECCDAAFRLCWVSHFYCVASISTTLSIKDTKHKNLIISAELCIFNCYAECHYAECRGTTRYLLLYDFITGQC
jgi:hypothetical protein